MGASLESWPLAPSVGVCHASQEPEVPSPGEANGEDKSGEDKPGEDKSGEDNLAQKLGETDTELVTPAKPEKAASAEASTEEPAEEAPNSGEKRKADAAEVADDSEDAKKAATA